MSKVPAIALVILLGLGLAAPVAAQSAAGDSELGFSASFFHFTDDDDTDGTLIADVRYGRFLTEAFQLGGGLTIGGSIDDLDKAVNFEIFAGYYFTPAETSTWYVRGGYFASLDEPGQGFVDAAAGYKSYFADNVAFFWEAAYGTAIGSDVTGGVVRSLAGITYTF